MAEQQRDRRNQDMELAKARRIAREERQRKEAEHAQQKLEELQTPVTAAQAMPVIATPSDAMSETSTSTQSGLGILRASGMKKRKTAKSVTWNATISDLREYELEESERDSKRGKPGEAAVPSLFALIENLQRQLTVYLRFAIHPVIRNLSQCLAWRRRR